jgi:hypothetical protein
MGTDENFCLRWNDFETNVSLAFRELRADKDLFDVTLACDDFEVGAWRTVSAHRLVLSACSAFFKQMFRHNAAASTAIVYLRGVRTSDLESVLDFIYRGEVNVAQRDLSSFLSVAEDLQIKGLSKAQQEDAHASAQFRQTSQASGQTRKSPASTSSHPPAAKRARKSSSSGRLDTQQSDPECHFSGVKSEAEEEPRPTRSAAGAETNSDAYEGNTNYEEAEESYNEYTGYMEGEDDAVEDEHDSTKGKFQFCKV